MNSIYQIKPWFQRQLQPIVNLLHRFGITPNMVTLLAILLSISFAWIITTNNSLVLWLPAVLLLRMMLNAIDGMLAKQFQLQSTLGEILNELGDIVSDVVLFIPLGAIFHFASWPALLFMLLIIINEYCGVLAKAITGTRRYDGPMGKSDRAFVLSICAILLVMFPQSILYLPYIIYILIFTILWGTFNRLHFIIKNQKEK
jgi:CDP-diacylglycerol--glycerol-3-phosphate 3-phosphatidyltransferase